MSSISIWGSQYPDLGGSPTSSPPQLGHRNYSRTFTRKSTQCLLILERKHAWSHEVHLSCTTGQFPFLKWGSWKVFLPFKQFHIQTAHKCSDPKLTRELWGQDNLLSIRHQINQIPALEFFLPLPPHSSSPLRQESSSSGGAAIFPALKQAAKKFPIITEDCNPLVDN